MIPRNVCVIIRIQYAAKHIYYQMAGWDAETGVPTPGKVAELDLEWAVEAEADAV